MNYETAAKSLIATERKRQIDVEGYAPEHDAQDGAPALLQAARCYLIGAPAAWPWAHEFWKPKGDVRNLVRAGALAQASIDVEPSLAAQSVYEQSVARLARTLSEAVAALSDDALIAEAASRGLSVMDAQEAARKQRIGEGIEALADGASLIAAERRRQIEVEGYTAEHDAGHAGDLLAAASCYLAPGIAAQMGNSVPFGWPWAREFWKPTPDDRVRELVKAGALIAAEIDRLRALLSADDEKERA